VAMSGGRVSPTTARDGHGERASDQDQIAASLDRIKGLCQALERASRTSAQHRALAENLHWESAAYLALVDACRGVDRKSEH
jgi:hypothetical protein